ncbi:hypothetical protein [Trueperella abortisuis]|uniref:hypothetical protein n=1 Tax=Trueperella abortisuis TaxID=445930 RepID=UPI0028936888|nr:hypothetical protein [Trueperella abortisuis]
MKSTVGSAPVGASGGVATGYGVAVLVVPLADGAGEEAVSIEDEESELVESEQLANSNKTTIMASDLRMINTFRSY